jgi:signal transduction histidine kinase
MELNKTKRWFYGLTLLWVVMLLGLGSWWLYLVFKLHSMMSQVNLPELTPQSNFLNMMRWEGSSFFVFLVLLGVSLFLMYFRDMKKTKSMQAFFASLSHELKTPLASMRLQAEVLGDLVETNPEDLVQIKNLSQRLIEDSHKLESELEKSLQLSRVDQDGDLSLTPVSLARFLRRHQQRFQSLQFDIRTDDEVMADELALNVIFRNLMENTVRHNGASAQVTITSKKIGSQVEVLYDDHGKHFDGQLQRLGDLFYKFNSTKGSGIGLYLIKNLMRKMQGRFDVLNQERLQFRLTFQAASGDEHV